MKRLSQQMEDPPSPSFPATLLVAPPEPLPLDLSVMDIPRDRFLDFVHLHLLSHGFWDQSRAVES